MCGTYRVYPRQTRIKELHLLRERKLSTQSISFLHRVTWNCCFRRHFCQTWTATVNKTSVEALSLSRKKRYSQHPRVERFEMPPCILISIKLFLAKLVFAMQIRRSPRYGDLKASLSKVFPTPDHRSYPSLFLSQNRNVDNDRQTMLTRR